MQLIWWQQAVLGLTALYSLNAFFQSVRECRDKKNASGLTPQYYPLGAFVWGDVIVFSLFWIVAAGTVWLLNDWLLFLLTISVFWVVRSLGETIYWFNQQFSSVTRIPPHTLPGFSWFHNDSIWFVAQIIAQCVTVISTIMSIYLAALWLRQVL